MRRAVKSIWNRGIAATFLAGLFAILPIVLTIAIMGWVGGMVADLLGPGSVVGDALGFIAGDRVSNEWVATLIGWAAVLVAIWTLGVFVRSMAKGKVEGIVERMANQVPLLKNVYHPVSQVVGLLKSDDKSDMKAMTVVYADFGEGGGPGFLGLLAGHQRYVFNDRECHVVYIPTSPVPMSGGIIFVPVDRVQVVDLSLDDLMQIYFSLGVMSSKVIPEKYIRPAEEGA